MASTVALRGRPLAILLKQLLAEAPSASEKPVAAAASAATASRRLYNTELRRYDDGDDDESGANEECNAPADDRRRDARDINVPCFFSTSDVLDPYGAPTSLGRLLALMEDTAAPRRVWWVAKEDDDAVHFKIPLPGLGKEHVKVWAEQNGLVIKGEGEKDPEDDADAAPLRYNSRIELPTDAFKMDKIKAEMKNGMLRVAVPKLKEEERKDVFQVKVE